MATTEPGTPAEASARSPERSEGEDAVPRRGARVASRPSQSFGHGRRPEAGRARPEWLRPLAAETAWVLLVLLPTWTLAGNSEVCIRRPSGETVCVSPEELDRVLSGGAPSRAPVPSGTVEWDDCRSSGGRRPPAAVETGNDEYGRAVRLASGFASRGRSVSWGSPSRGKLTEAAELPGSGYGYRVLAKSRTRRHGTDELVGGLIRASADLKRNDPGGSELVFGDLSGPGGGDITRHVSHENGRDVDILFHRTDAAGRPLQADRYLSFDSKGRAAKGSIRFDVARNWSVVRELLTNEHFGPRVQYVLVYDPLKALLLAHARRSGEPAELLRRASSLLLQPQDSLPHDDHFHLRVRASGEDAALAKK